MTSNRDVILGNSRLLRTFFAIELDQATRHTFEQVILFLREHYHVEKIKWVKPSNLHITLRFIGATPSEQIPVLITRVRETIANFSTFSLFFGDIALFPVHHPHVLAVNFKLSQELAQLLLALEQAVIACGFALETRPFQPHLTLARLSRRPRPLPEIPIKLPQILAVNSIVLFQSELTPDGSLYTPLEYFQLQ